MTIDQSPTTAVSTHADSSGGSYTTTGFPVLRVMRRGLSQWRAVREIARNAPQQGTDIVQELRDFENSVRETTGLTLSKGMTALEIGHGQLQAMIAFVASKGCEATGIDLDVTPRGLFDVSSYWKILRTNGLLRMAKSMARELSGVNRAMRNSLARQFGWSGWPSYRSMTMDATKLSFADSSFDLVYSTDVFEHLPNPEVCLREVVRVLKPGGGLWIRSNHFANENAMHDLRVITRAPNAPRPWAHLVPQLKSTVEQGAYVNKFREADFRRIADSICPGATVGLVPSRETHRVLRDTLAEYRSDGLLGASGEQAFSDDELLASYVLITWRKPA